MMVVPNNTAETNIIEQRLDVISNEKVDPIFKCNLLFPYYFPFSPTLSYFSLPIFFFMEDLTFLKLTDCLKALLSVIILQSFIIKLKT